MIFSLPFPSFFPSRAFCLAGAGSAFDSPEFLEFLDSPEFLDALDSPEFLDSQEFLDSPEPLDALDSPEFLDAFARPVPLEVLAPALSLDSLAAVPVWFSPFCPLLLFA